VLRKVLAESGGRTVGRHVGCFGLAIVGGRYRVRVSGENVDVAARFRRLHRRLNRRRSRHVSVC